MLAPTFVTVDVPIYLAAELSPSVLAGALKETERIFEPGGIELRFDLAPEGHSSRPLAIVVVQARPARFKVSRSCSRGLHDHRLGQTQLGSRRLTLWSEQVARAVDGNWDRQELPHVDDHVYARALGRVLAHELGHLLLRLNGHRGGAFRLSADDLDAIRATLVSIEP